MSEERQTALTVPEAAFDLMAALKQHQLYLDVCQALLDDDDYATIRGKKHRKRSGWAKLRRAFSVSCERIEEREISLEDDWGISCLIRAYLPNGRFEDGDGTCMASDLIKASMDPSLHNVRSKALTRAKNRATADLLGAGIISAEELKVRNQHWIDNARVRDRFWQFAKGVLSLTEEQVCEALGVEHLHDYDGTMNDAKAALEEFAHAG